MATARPASSRAYAAELPLAGVAVGSYILQAVVDEDGTIGPYRIVGQEVDFSVGYDPHVTRMTKLRYLARIVTPGDCAWEPTSIRLAAAPQDMAFTAPSRVTVADR